MTELRPGTSPPPVRMPIRREVDMGRSAPERGSARPMVAGTGHQAVGAGGHAAKGACARSRARARRAVRPRAASAAVTHQVRLVPVLRRPGLPAPAPGERVDRPRRRLRVGEEALLHFYRDRPLEKPLDRPEEIHLVRAGERDRDAGRAGAACPPDAVDVVPVSYTHLT